MLPMQTMASPVTFTNGEWTILCVVVVLVFGMAYGLGVLHGRMHRMYQQ